MSEEETPDRSPTLELEEHKKLEIRLSRLPEQAERLEYKSTSPSPPSSRTSSSASYQNPTKRIRKISSERSKKKVSRISSTKSSTSTSSFQSSPSSSKKQPSTPVKRKKLSKNYGPVKIKINFLTRKLVKTVEASQKTALVEKVGEVDFETKERDAADEATKKMQEESRLNSEAELTLCREDPRFAKPSFPMTPDGSSDESSEGEYRFRPIRAAAAAAMRKIDSDSDTLKGSSYRNKFGTQSPKGVPKSRGRRTRIKRAMAQRGIRRSLLPDEIVSVYFVHSLFYKLVYYQTGDIIGLQRKHGTYFAQVLNLVQFSDAAAFAEVSYLLPTISCDAYPFEPDNYERRDSIPPVLINLDEAEFVTHFPFNYYNHDYRHPRGTGSMNLPWPLFKNLFDIESEVEVKVEELSVVSENEGMTGDLESVSEDESFSENSDSDCSEIESSSSQIETSHGKEIEAYEDLQRSMFTE